MSGWNYRLVEIKHKHPIYNDYYFDYSIQEVYYNDKDEPDGLTTESAGIGFVADDLEDVYDELERVLKAFTKPVLYFDDDKNKFYSLYEQVLDKNKIRSIIESTLEKLNQIEKGTDYDVYS